MRWSVFRHKAITHVMTMPTEPILKLHLSIFPIEGYGLSNNPKVMGPPKYEDSAFDFRLPEMRILVKS
jgi:hypothetical protein